MSPILERVFEFLMELGWTFWMPVNGDNDTWIVAAEGQHAQWRCQIESLEDDQYLHVRVPVPFYVSATQVRDIEEYLCRASTLIPIGGFVFDRDTGIIAFQHTLDVTDDLLTLDRFRRFIKHAVDSADQHLPGLMGVTSGSMRPLDALGLVVRFPVDAVVNRANDTLRW